jgi:hypothetical protein
MVSQKECVYNAVQSAIKEGLTGKDIAKFAVEQVAEDLMSGECAHKQGPLPEDEAKRYAVGLVGNWLKKDTRINATGLKYEPGEKRGPQLKDPTLKDLVANLKSLKVHKADETLIARVEEAVSARKALIAEQKGAAKVRPIEEVMADLAAKGIAV